MNAWSDLKFVDPLWLAIGVGLCLALLWGWRRYDLRQRRAMAKFASAHLHARLTVSVSPVRQRWKRALFALALACVCVALARPQAGFRWESVTRRGIELVFAIDTSRSMLTPDVKPDRLTRAKLAVDDFVNRLDGDGVGLVAFAGSAFLQCPVTLDYEAFHESLSALDTDIIPLGGTDIASAIRETQTALEKSSGSDKILILVTDGEDLDGNALSAAQAAGKAGLKIYTVGVGSSNGELIPLPEQDGGGFVKDESGQYVKSRLDEAGLKAIAEAAGGLYQPLGTSGQGLDTIYRQALAPLARHDLESRQQKIYTERFQWPLALAFASLLASLTITTRRRKLSPGRGAQMGGTAAGTASSILLVALLLPVHRAEASPAEAEQAYKKGDFAAAENAYSAAAKPDTDQPELQFDIGAAAYKAGHFSEAAEAFQKSLGGKQSADPKRLAEQQSAYYNAGNALYRVGQESRQSDPQQTLKQWDQAVASYQAALQLHPDDADSRYNLDVVKRKLDELKQQQDQKPSQGDKNKQDQNKPDQQNQPGQNSGQQQNKQDPSQDGQKSARNDASKDSQDSKDQSSSASDNSAADKDAQAKDSKPGDKESQQSRPDAAQNGNQPQASDQKAADANSRRDQKAEPQNGQPGQMSKDEARALLNAMKSDERGMPAARMGSNDEAQDRPPAKNW